MQNININLEKAELFEYDHQQRVDGSLQSDYTRSLEFKLTAEDYEELEIPVATWTTGEGETVEERLVLNYPVSPEFSFVGRISDQHDEYYYGDEALPAIGDLQVDLEVNYNFEEGVVESYGSLDSPRISWEGESSGQFATIEDLQDPSQLEVLQMGESTFTVDDYFTIEGSSEFIFSGQEMGTADQSQPLLVPEYIEFDGRYQDISQSDGLIFENLIVIELDADKYDFSQPESADNYLPVKLLLVGNLRQSKADFDVELTLTREQYQLVETELKYEFDGGRFIAGSGNFNIVEEEVDLKLDNEGGLIVDLDTEYPDVHKIGELQAADGTRLADITFDDEIVFEFTDGDLISLFSNN